MLWKEILWMLLRKEGYRCRSCAVLPDERIEQGNRSSDSTSLVSSSRGVALSLDDVYVLKSIRLHQPRSGGARSKKGNHVVPFGELDGIPIAFVAWFGVIS
ncbi:hypothetical protein Tco_1252014 [Tanacetum coccineum]